MGEAILQGWAGEVGLIANKSSDQDATGWDFILEWPAPLDPSACVIPLDKIPSPMKCLVQVKTTGKDIARWQVSLSNWLYLIHNPVPVFFLLLHFDRNNKCDQAHLVHVGAAYIEAVQREFRIITKSVQTKSNTKKLNTSRMQFTWSDSDLLPSLDGEGLQAAILKHVPSGLDNYIKWKQTQCASLGYENGNAQFNFTAVMPRHLDISEHLIKFDLGLAPPIEIATGERLDDRFGIPISVEKLPAGTRFQVVPSPEPVKGRVVINAMPPRGKMFLDCDVYLPKAFGRFVRSVKLKARFDAGDWNFLVPFAGGDAVDVSFNLPDTKTVFPLSRLYLSARIILAMDMSIAKASPLDFSIFYNNQRLGTGQINPMQTISPALVKWAETIESAWLIAQHFSIEGKVQTAAADLARQNTKIILSSDYLMPEPRRLKVTTWLNSPDIKTDALWCVPLPTMVDLGGYKVQFAAGLLGKLESTGNSQNEMWQYDFYAASVCRCSEDVSSLGEGKEKSLCELTAIVTEHHKHDREILHVEFTT